MTLGMAGLTPRVVSLTLGMEAVTLRMEIATLEVDGLIIGMAGVALGMQDPALGIAGLTLGQQIWSWGQQHLDFAPRPRSGVMEQPRERRCLGHIPRQPRVPALPLGQDTAPGHLLLLCHLHRSSFGARTLRELCLPLRLPPATAAPKKTDPCV